MSVNPPRSTAQTAWSVRFVVFLIVMLTVCGCAAMPAGLTMFFAPITAELTLGRLMCPLGSDPQVRLRSSSTNGRSTGTSMYLQCREGGRLVADRGNVFLYWVALWSVPVLICGYWFMQRGKREQAARMAAGRSAAPASARAQSAGAPPPRADPAGVAERLAALEHLRAEGLISDEEYTEKRAEILAAL